MTQTDLFRAPTTRLDAGSSSDRQGATRWLPALAIFLLAAALQSLGHLNGDDSWFITFAEKYLDGFAPYIDISDPNPPIAFLVYVPAVALARAFAVRPEFAVGCLAFLGALLAIGLAGRILHRAGALTRDEVPSALILALYLALILPGFCFAEREHIAVLVLLPFTALLAVRAGGREAAAMEAFVAGLGAGLAMTFKPYFLLPLLCALIAVTWRQPRRLLRLAPELIAIALMLVAHAALIVGAFPDYLRTLPLVLDVYAPVRDLWRNLLLAPLFIANAALLVVVAYRARLGAIVPAARLCAALSFGFLVTSLIQGKGWNNHALPGITFALLALMIELRLAFASPTAVQRPRRVTQLIVFASLCGAPFLFGGATLINDSEEHPGLTAAVAAVAPQKPKIAALAEQLDFGHPLVRHLGGTWIGRQNCLWIAWGVKYLRGSAEGGAAAARRAQYLADDLAAFAEDVQNGKPDILVIESKDLESWARGEPALTRVLDLYVQTASAGDIEIWQPRKH